MCVRERESVCVFVGVGVGCGVGGACVWLLQAVSSRYVQIIESTRDRVHACVAHARGKVFECDSR